MGSDLIEVKTNLVTDTGDPNSMVYVLFGPKQYVRKRIGDLLVGDRVFIEKESSLKSLSELEPYMEVCRDYLLARNTVMVSTRDGSITPRFRIQLIRNLAKKVNGIDDDLEFRLLERSNSLTGDELVIMADYLENLGVNRTTSINWLDGSVVIPLRKNLELIKTELPDICGIFDEFSERNGIVYGAYNYWRVARWKLMKKLGQLGRLEKEEHILKIERNPVNSENCFDEMPVVDEVISMLAAEGDLRSYISFGRVQGRKSVKATKIENRKPDAIYTGFARQIPDELGFRQIDMKTVFLDFKLVQECFSDLLYREMRERLCVTASLDYFLSLQILDRHTTYSDVAISDSMARIRKDVGGSTLGFYNTLEEPADLIYSELCSGDLDRKYNLKMGTTRNLFETYLTLRGGLPNLYFLHTCDLNQRGRVQADKDRKKTREISRRLERTEDRLKSCYGLDLYSGLLISADLRNLLYGADTKLSDDYEALLTNFERNWEPYLKEFKRKGWMIYTKDSISEILRRHNLTQAMVFVRPVNFLYADKYSEV